MIIRRIIAAAMGSSVLLASAYGCSSDRGKGSPIETRVEDDALTISRAIYGRIATRRTANDDYSVGVLSATTYVPAQYDAVDFTTEVGLPTHRISEEPLEKGGAKVAHWTPLDPDAEVKSIFATSRSVTSILAEAKRVSPDMPDVKLFTVLKVHTHAQGEDRIGTAVVLWFEAPDKAILRDASKEKMALRVVDYSNAAMVQVYADPESAAAQPGLTAKGDPPAPPAPGGGGAAPAPGGLEPAPPGECNAYSVEIPVMSGGVKYKWDSSGHWCTGPNCAHYGQEGMTVKCTCHANCNSSCDATMTQTECKDTLFEHVMGSTVKASGEQQFAGGQRGARCAGGQSCVSRWCFLGMCGPSPTDVYISLRDDPQYPALPPGATMGCAAPCVSLQGDLDHFRGQQLGDSFTFECPVCPGSNANVKDFVALERDCTTGKPIYKCVPAKAGQMFFQSCNYALEWVKKNEPDPQCLVKAVAVAIAN